MRWHLSDDVAPRVSLMWLHEVADVVDVAP